MIPAFFMSSKIDYEDENIINMLRIAYFSMQAITLLCVYFSQNKIAAKKDRQEIFVPVPPKPFSGETEASMKKTTYHQHDTEQAQQLMTQTLMGLAMIGFIHFKMGVKQPLFLQSLMAPVTLYESGVFKKFILGDTSRVWGEKLPGEEGAVETIKDENDSGATTNATIKEEKKTSSLEDIILNTWDAGKNANIATLLKAINKDNVNLQTKEGNWSALMILCGLPHTAADDIKKLLSLGADVSITDDDGCNALHWASYHDRPKAAEVLVASVKGNDEKLALLKAKSSESSTPIEVAQELNNAAVLSILSKINDEIVDVKDID